MSFDTSQISYVSLRDIVAERTDGVVFWTGSGLSSEAGLPTWTELKCALLAALYEQIDQLDNVGSKERRRAADLIREEQNNWRAFERLKSQLGTTTWRSHIREVLRPSASADSPPIYDKLWRLRPHGILTLNLDRLTTKAYMDINPGPLLTEFSGNQVARYSYVLKRPYPFVCNLHGMVDDVDGWTLTQYELGERLADPGYQNFLRSCLSAKTIVFVGISADDIAVGGFVEQLSNLDIDVGEHYWFTPRRDLETSQWAEDRGVRLIRYDAPHDNHQELLEAFDDLTSFVPLDDVPDLDPLVPKGLIQKEAIPNPGELLALDAGTIREALNREASRILTSSSSSTQDTVEEYSSFLSLYDEVIYRAWYTSTDAGVSQLFGHSLHEEVARGAFGKVYRAIDSDGNDVAVKVLHEEMRRDPTLLQAFRRGVRSMEILGDRNVQGMVPYRQAFEIPAFVVMDWIDGPNLHEAVSSMLVSDWELILRISSEIADVVRRGHVLPERVLHRDIRPSNVMLSGFHSDPVDWEVVVLDFDLSWHRGAFEKSVTYGSTILGYLAPEQIQKSPGVSTRHAAVDSFGLGMVLFFMLSRRDPVPNQHLHADWDRTLLDEASNRKCNKWVSAPQRFARLVKAATLHSQSERWDMTQIQSELQRLQEAILDPQAPKSAELVAEEIAARCRFSEGYEWDANMLAAVKQQASEVEFEIRGDESSSRVVASIRWGKPGVQGKRHLGKWIEPSMKSAREILLRSGWQVEESSSRYAHIQVVASLEKHRALQDIVGTVDSLDSALDKLRFS